MAYFDYTNAFGPGKSGNNVKYIGVKVQTDKHAVALNRTIEETCDRLINAYREVLKESDITRAKTDKWGRRSVEEYENSFLSNVLFAYRIWEVDEAWLSKLQTLIQEHNPEWLSSFLKNKATKYANWKR